MIKTIAVLGGLGYVGSVLVPKLLARNYRVVIYDKGYFGTDHVELQPNCKLVIGDIRDTDNLAFALLGCDAVIDLAAISNDASFELDEALGRTVNYECFESMVIAAKGAGVKRFIYASTSSVYGVSDEKDVTEDHPLVPLTDYNKYKGLCEPILFKHQSSDFTCTAIRPATVCGYSPRMRFDLSVNLLTNQAYSTNTIKVFGGSQMRPNLHIRDMCYLYQLLLQYPKEAIAGQTFNAGYENMTIMEIARTVQRIVSERKGVDIKLETVPTDDIRSYHINSDKIKMKLGFIPTFTIADAIRDICIAFEDGLLPDSMNDPRYYNVRTMKALHAG